MYRILSNTFFLDGTCIGIIINENSPYNHNGEAEKQLAAILNNFTNFKKEAPQENDQKLGRIGSTLIKGAEILGKNMEKGAEKASNLIKYASEKQKTKIQPVEHDVKVSPMLKTSMKGNFRIATTVLFIIL